MRVLCMAHGALHLVEKHWGDYTAEVNVTRDRR